MKIGLMQRMPRAGWLRARSKSTFYLLEREDAKTERYPQDGKDVYWLGRVPVRDALTKLKNSISHFPASPARSRTDIYLSCEANA